MNTPNNLNMYVIFRNLSEASGTKLESNQNQPKKLTVPIASMEHDLNSDELLFAVGK